MAGTWSSPACSTALEPPADWGLQCRSPLFLQLLLQLGEEAPVSPLGDELLRSRLDHPYLVEAQSIETHGILGVVLTPPAVRDILHGLQSIVVILREALVHDDLCRAVGLQGAHGVRLENRPDGTFGGDWVLAHKVFVSRHGAAEVLGPRPVHGAFEHHMTDALGTQFLRVRWEAQVGINLGLAEQLFRLRSRALDEVDIRPWVQANIA